MKQVKTNQVSALTQVAKSLANTEPTQATIQMSQNTKTLWVDYAKDYKGSENTKALLADSLFADGIRSYHIVGANDEDKSLVALRNQIIQLIVNADPADAKLYNAEPKTLPLSQQAVQTVFKTKTIPTILGNAKKALASREANIGKEGKAKPKTKEQMAKQSLLNFIKYAKESKNGYEGITKDIAMAESFAVLKQVK
jgi:hypothetical protein